MKKVIWGVLSTAKIGLKRVLPGMLKSELLEVRAIASRSATAAREAAAALGIPRAYGSYEELLADPEIEAVYNPLPNHLHVPLTVASGRGRQACAVREADRADRRGGPAAASGRGPRADHGSLHGALPPAMAARPRADPPGPGGDAARGADAVLVFQRRSRQTSATWPTSAAAALYDIGCYPIVAGRFFFEAEPRRAIALVDRDPAFGTDRLTSALLDFGSGRHLDFTVSTQCVPYQRTQLCGSQGTHRDPDPGQRAAGCQDAPVSRRRLGARWIRDPHRDAARERPVPASGRGFLAGDPRRDTAALWCRGRGAEHAHHRRAVPLREERPLGRRGVSARSTTPATPGLIAVGLPSSPEAPEAAQTKKPAVRHAQEGRRI